MIMEIVKYETEEEAEQIKANKVAAGFVLVEIQNITEGNFLGFQKIGWTPPEPEETQVQHLQKQVDVLSAKTDALATGQEMQEDVITEIVMHVYE